jgi:CrcB protein
LGGALGSAARYLLSGWFATRIGADFPYGTLFVNVTGSFIIGFFLAFAEDRVWLSPYARLFFAVGVVGGYTTFSTFEFETILLLRNGEFLRSAVYCIGSVAIGGIGAFAGLALGMWI